MKTKTLFYMALTAMMTTLAACSQDDELMDAAPKQAQIEFEITDGGYGGDEATRAKEEGLRTKFEDGDKCGLYIIENGKFIASNVKLTAEAGENGEITWKAADGAISGVTENSKYFLYYPYYASNNSVWVNNPPSLGNVDTDVFSNIIKNFDCYPYQNTHAYYTQDDLMTATGTASTGNGGKLKVSFSLTHRMALAVIEVPKTKYSFTNVTDGAEYIVASSVDFSDSECKPLRMEDGTYRLVFNSYLADKVKSITGIINGNKKFTIPADKLKGITKGTYKTFRIGGGVEGTPIEKSHELQVGDYLLKDGNLIRQDALTEEQKADVAAVVFEVGHNNKDNSSYLNTGIKSEKCRGYAVALKDVEGKQKWANERTAITTSQSTTDWSGYSSQQMLVTEGLDKFPAAKACAEYGTKEGESEALSTSSGWFLPAVGQMKACFVKTVKSAINQCGGIAYTGNYWSSTTTGTLYNVYTVNGPLTPGIYYMDGNEFNVRPVLAF